MTEFEQNKLVPNSFQELCKGQVKHCDEESQMYAHWMDQFAAAVALYAAIM